MAFIPDDAVLASGDISATAFRLYAYYCMRRNRKSQGFTCPKAMVLSDMRDISEPTYFRAKDQLISAGWIATNGNFITPLKGFDTLKNESFESDKTIKNESVTIKNDSPTLKNDSERYIYTPATKPATLPEDEVFLFWVSTMKKKQTAIFGKKRKNAVIYLAKLMQIGFEIMQNCGRLFMRDIGATYDGINIDWQAFLKFGSSGFLQMCLATV